MPIKPDPMANPDALDGAPAPRKARYSVNGTTIYAELRGEGSPVLLIPGGAEDAESWRAVAERLEGHTVVTYDRRGTLRSGRDDWPGRGSAQHADDAAALLREIGLGRAVAFGGSSAGIVATQLALRHPTLIRRGLVYEPGYFRAVPGGANLQAVANAAVAHHLDRQPGDWVGAYRAFVRAAAPSAGPDQLGFLAPPAGRDWFARREEGNAEAFARDDLVLLTMELVDEAALAHTDVELRFAHGTASPAIFRQIAAQMASVRGAQPDAIEGAGHTICFQPELAARYIETQTGG
jgi:pimeloyl-ACP methyl ester carboxylesterase